MFEPLESEEEQVLGPRLSAREDRNNMARKQKKRRTHVDDSAMEKSGGEKIPKSFVVRRCTLFRCRCSLPMRGNALKWQNLRGGKEPGEGEGDTVESCGGQLGEMGKAAAAQT